MTSVFFHHVFTHSITPGESVSAALWDTTSTISNKLFSPPSIHNFLNRAIHAEQRRHLTIHLQPLIPHDSVTNVTRDYFTEAATHRGARSCLRWFTFCLTTRPAGELNSRSSLSHPGLLGFSDKQLNNQMLLSLWSQSLKSVVGVEPVCGPSSD